MLRRQRCGLCLAIVGGRGVASRLNRLQERGVARLDCSDLGLDCGDVAGVDSGVCTDSFSFGVEAPSRCSGACFLLTQRCLGGKFGSHLLTQELLLKRVQGLVVRGAAGKLFGERCTLALRLLDLLGGQLLVCLLFSGNLLVEHCLAHRKRALLLGDFVGDQGLFVRKGVALGLHVLAVLLDLPIDRALDGAGQRQNSSGGEVSDEGFAGELNGVGPLDDHIDNASKQSHDVGQARSDVVGKALGLATVEHGDHVLELLLGLLEEVVLARLELEQLELGVEQGQHARPRIHHGFGRTVVLEAHHQEHVAQRGRRLHGAGLHELTEFGHRHAGALGHHVDRVGHGFTQLLAKFFHRNHALAGHLLNRDGGTVHDF